MREVLQHLPQPGLYHDAAALSRAQWNAIVNKMIKVMGAPIGGTDEKVIVNYLSTQYGTGQ